jgi:hypothetical protein
MIKLNSQKDTQGTYFKKIMSGILSPFLYAKAKEQQVFVDIDPVDMI